MRTSTLALAAGLIAATVTATEARQASLQGTPTPSAPRPPAVQQGPPQSSPGLPLVSSIEKQNAREIREQLRDVLEKYPPAVREVLRLDPTLLYRADYLATYPVLASFLQQNPEIAYNPTYYLGESRVEEANRNNTANEALRAFGDIAEMFMTALIIATISMGIILLARTALEHRRWQKAMKAQMDLHAKLVDRFPSSDELLAYLQTPAGRAFAEVTPVPQGSPVRPMHAPLGRIMWSLQAGIVVTALGTGFMVVGRNATVPELGQMLAGVGIIALAIGVGFVGSALVSYVLSHRMGLVPGVATRHSTETT